jgi:steroid delta-isomerase-like uncharacterized protein
MKQDIEFNRKLIEAYFYEVWNNGDFNKMEEIIAPDYINHNPSTPNPPPGPEGLKPIISAMRNGIPDLCYTIKDAVITADKVVVRVSVTGTHLGNLFGIPPTGKAIAIEQINIERIKSGKIIEHWRVTEELKMMQQLGLVG